MIKNLIFQPFYGIIFPNISFLREQVLARMPILYGGRKMDFKNFFAAFIRVESQYVNFGER